ncbi:MAG TPA: hypothetical protein VGG19_00570 [Tepidisphaeraceae bacterium]|jgi:hypothetical protein
MDSRILRACALSLLVSAFVPALHVAADPLPGEVLKFSQLPEDSATNPNGFPGHDELSTAILNSDNVYSGTFAADDFADKFSTPVVHVQWWGSYLNAAAGAAPNHVQQFLISFESDVPAGPNGNFSTPGSVLSSQVVTVGALAPASGTFTESLFGNTTSTEPTYMYNAELKAPFAEQPDTVYWLKIVALTNPNDGIQWGWHNRDFNIPDPLASTAPAVTPGENNIGNAAFPIYHFQDDAVTGDITYSNTTGAIREAGFQPLDYNPNTDGTPAGAIFSEDLAFNLYTVPEPAAFSCLAVPLFFLRRNARR